MERRVALVAAWNAAHWTVARTHGVDVSGELSELLGDDPPGAAPSAPEKTPEQVWNDVLNWAMQTRGCHIETHDKPIM